MNPVVKSINEFSGEIKVKSINESRCAVDEVFIPRVAPSLPCSAVIVFILIPRAVKKTIRFTFLSEMSKCEPESETVNMIVQSRVPRAVRISNHENACERHSDMS